MKKMLLTMIALFGLFLFMPTEAEAASGVWAQKGGSPGTATVGWSDRGGSCDVRYTESGQSAWKYQTVTNCDSGSINVGSLVAGRNYKFSVAQGGMNWSAPVYAVAQGRTAKMAVSNAPQHKETPVEKLPASNFKAKQVSKCSGQGSMATMGGLNHDERKTGKCGTGATNVRTVSGKMSGEVTVYWTPNTVSDGQYHLVYGTESGHYTMGALNVGGASNSYTVRGLAPGQRYYFKLIPMNQGKAAGSSWEVSDLAR